MTFLYLLLIFAATLALVNLVIIQADYQASPREDSGTEIDSGLGTTHSCVGVI